MNEKNKQKAKALAWCNANRDEKMIGDWILVGLQAYNPELHESMMFSNDLEREQFEEMLIANDGVERKE